MSWLGRGVLGSFSGLLRYPHQLTLRRAGGLRHGPRVSGVHPLQLIVALGSRDSMLQSGIIRAFCSRSMVMGQLMPLTKAH